MDVFILVIALGALLVGVTTLVRWAERRSTRRWNGERLEAHREQNNKQTLK